MIKISLGKVTLTGKCTLYSAPYWPNYRGFRKAGYGVIQSFRFARFLWRKRVFK